MAHLSAAADPGSGHLLGHVLGDGQAASVAPYHVGTSSVCVFAVHPVSDHLCPHRPQTDRAPVSLSGTTGLTPSIAPMIQLHSQIALRMTLPLFLSSMTCLFFPRTSSTHALLIKPADQFGKYYNFYILKTRTNHCSSFS